MPPVQLAVMAAFAMSKSPLSFTSDHYPSLHQPCPIVVLHYSVGGTFVGTCFRVQAVAVLLPSETGAALDELPK